jgi:hypothetical protein
MMFRRRAGIPVAVALLCAGCSSGAGDPAADAPTASASSTETATYEHSPINDYLALANGWTTTAEENKKEDVARIGGVEDLIAQCMKQQGFEYTPDVSQYHMSYDYDIRPDDEDWVAQWGYGIVDGGSSNYSDPRATPTDVNAGYRDSLSPAELDAYHRALMDPDKAPPDAKTTKDWSVTGCQGWASYQWSLEHPTPNLSGPDSQFAALFKEIDEFHSDLQANWAAAQQPFDADWSQCMADAGYPGYAQQSDARDQLSAEYLQLPITLGSAQEQRAAFQAKEIPIATADLACRKKTDYVARRKTAQDDAERQFVADHKDELEALKAAAEQAYKH